MQFFYDEIVMNKWKMGNKGIKKKSEYCMPQYMYISMPDALLLATPQSCRNDNGEAIFK